MDTDKVAIYNYNKDKLIQKDDFLKETGYSPEFVADYLALAGDSADNIPGAKGIGKVGASKLINQYHTLEAIYEDLENCGTPRIQKLMFAEKLYDPITARLLTAKSQFFGNIQCRFADVIL